MERPASGRPKCRRARPPRRSQRERAIVHEQPGQLAQHIRSMVMTRPPPSGGAPGPLPRGRRPGTAAQRRQSRDPRPARPRQGLRRSRTRRNADSIMPTANLSVFSGTRASGRCTTRPTRRPAGTPQVRRTGRNEHAVPALSAITMNTTSSPSSSTALEARERSEPIEPGIVAAGCSRNSAVSAANVIASFVQQDDARRAQDRFSRQPCRTARAESRSRAARRAAGRDRATDRAPRRSGPTPKAGERASPAGRQPRTVATASTMVSAPPLDQRGQECGCECGRDGRPDMDEVIRHTMTPHPICQRKPTRIGFPPLIFVSRDIGPYFDMLEMHLFSRNMFVTN